jgi:hypothetical protein
VARQNLAAVQDYLARAPLGFGQWPVALDYALSRRAKIACEIAIFGPPDNEATRALLGTATSGFRPSGGGLRARGNERSGSAAAGGP